MNMFKRLGVVAILLVVLLPVVIADDAYKPYLHKAEVPEHPELSQTGVYSTDLFPGAATYSYPIEAPKGTNGLAPSISLQYNSQAVIGDPSVVGAGWFLADNHIMRNVNFSISDQSDDYFIMALNGKNYQLVYESEDGFYRTETDEYFKIENKTSGGNDYWVVTAKDGKEYRFGFMSDARVDSNTGQNYSLKFYVDQVQDTFDNRIFYNYGQDLHSGDLGTIYLQSIVYNNDQKRKINFSYESSTRPDVRFVYQQGNKVNVTRRLSSIDVTVDNDFVRGYRFSYTSLNDQETLSGLSNISSIGADESSVLHTIKFDYYKTEQGFTKNTTTWFPPVLFSESGGDDYGIRLLDINGDGFADFMKWKEGHPNNEVWLNQKNGSWQESSWTLPVYIVESDFTDGGVRFGDVNADGLVDVIIATHYTGDVREVYLNDGDGTWTDVTSTWGFPSGDNHHFVDGSGYSTGIRLIDLNGDGRIDRFEGTDIAAGDKLRAYINTESGWEDASGFTPPVLIVEDIPDDGLPIIETGVRILDFNGDGLPDLLQGEDLDGEGTKKAWLNNGTGWEDVSSTWAPPLFFTTTDRLDNGVRIIDVNNDGLPDLIQDFANETTTSRSAYINTGSGWEQDSSWQSPETFTDGGNNIGRRLADVNGDGFTDVVVSYKNATGDFQYTWTKNTTVPYMLKNITHEFGGVTSLGYKDSTTINSSGDNALNFNLKVLHSVIQDNGMSGDFNVDSVFNYSFSGGKYDYVKREFRGFGIVNESLPDGTMVAHYFNQSTVLAGKEYKTETFKDGSLYEVKEKLHTDTINGSRHIVTFDQIFTIRYDGVGTNGEPTYVNYSYDQFGNVVNRTYSDGGKLETFDYWYNTSLWILNRLKSTKLYDGEKLIEESTYSYDGVLNAGPKGHGAITRIEQRLDTAGGNKIARFAYDNYGNVIRSVDALGRVTESQFDDDLRVYKVLETNALGHRIYFSYDLGTGNVLSEEKNKLKTYFTYDTFGRPLKEIQQYDSSSFPTREYIYTLNGTAPEKIEVKQREGENDSLDTSYFYDGFGSLIQIRSDADDSKQVVKDFFYDDLFRVDHESIPYFANESDDLDSDSTFTTNYTYDALGRITKITNPDGTSKDIVFNRFNVSAFDENGHKKVYMLDSYDRIVHVYEYNNDPVLGGTAEEMYNTSYMYDVMDNVVKIKDSKGNDFLFGFDSLGRRVSMVDPDLGSWNYAYDKVGNLISQADARSELVLFHYDDLDRLTRKVGSDETVTLSYDEQYFGALTNATNNDQVHSFTYDKRYRVTDAKVTMNGTTFDVSYAYDNMDRKSVEGVFANKTAIGYSYNAQGLLSQIPGYVNGTTYNAFGNPLNRTFVSGKVMEYSYESDTGRLTEIKTDTVQEMDYSYDDAGNIVRINDVANGRDQQMTYDYLDRLVNVTVVGETSYRYVYDAIGRIQKKIVDYNSTTRMIYNGDQAHAPSSVVESTAGVMVHKVEELAVGTRNKTVSFYLVNEKNFTVTDVNWTIDWGDGNSVSASDLINLSEHENVMVVAGHEYSVGGDYDIAISATYGNVTDSASSLGVKFGLKTENLTFLDQEANNATLEFRIKNTLSENITNVTWDCTTGINSITGINLTTNQESFVFIETNYSTPGLKALTCNATSTNGDDSEYREFVMQDVVVSGYNSTTLAGDKKLVNFMITNHFTTQNVNWTILSEGTSYTDLISIAGDNTTFVNQQVNYSYAGEKTIALNVSTPYTSDNETESFVLRGLEIVDYVMSNSTYSSRIFGYTVHNYWADDMSVHWNMSDPVVNSSSSTNMSYNDTMFVFIEENYTVSGQKDPVFNVYNGSFVDTLADKFVISLVEILENNALFASIDSTIFELVIRNNMEPDNVSWLMNTGEQFIQSTDKVFLNNTETAFVYVETSYLREAGYLTEAFVNTTSYNHTLDGEVVV